MKKLIFFTVLFFSFFFFSCDSDDDSTFNNLSFDDSVGELQELSTPFGQIVNSSTSDVLNTPEGQIIDVISNVLIFGRYFSDRNCENIDCSLVFKLEDNKIYKDVSSIDLIPEVNFEGEFVELSNKSRKSLLDLYKFFPNELLFSETITYGSDLGFENGYYLEYDDGNTNRYWFFDSNIENLPDSLVDYVTILEDEISELESIYGEEVVIINDAN